MSYRRCALVFAAAAMAVLAAGCGGGGNGGGGSTPVVQITTQSLPSGTTGASYAAQVLADFPHPPGLFLITGGDLPAGLTLDSAGGKIQGYPKQTGLFRFQIAARDGIDPSLPKGRDVVFDQDVREFTVSIGQGPPNIIPQSLPVAQYRTTYSYAIDVRGGVAPYTFQWVGGDALPEGLQLTSDGRVAGVPTKSEKHPYVFEVRVTDHDGAQDTDSLGIEVVILPLTILTSSIPNGAQGKSYDATLLLSSQGGGDPIVWSQVPPSPGSGETDLNSVGMALTGTGHVTDLGAGPTGLGTFLFTAQVTDAAGQVATRQYSLKIVSSPVITAVNPNKATLPGPFTVTGLNFVAGATLSFLRAGTGPTITPTFVDQGTLTFASPPPGLVGPVDVKVTNPDGGTFTKKTAILYPINTVSFGSKGLISSGLSSTGLAVGDLDGDGYADIVHAGASGVTNYPYPGGVTSTTGGLVYLRNVGGGASWSATTLDSTNWFDVKIADMNTDGAPDIVAIGASGLKVWFNTPSSLGTFTAGTSTALPSGVNWPSEMAVSLIDTDLLPDVVFGVGNTNAGRVYVFKSNGSGGFTQLSANTTFLGGSAYGVLALAVGDTNGDGRPDIHAGTGYTFYGPVWWRSLTDPTGAMGPWSGSSEYGPYYANTTGMGVGDFLGTGAPAVVASNVQDPSDGGARKLQVFSGGSPSSPAMTLATPSSFGKYIAVGDLDLDARQDFIMSMNTGWLLVYRGSSVGTGAAPSFSFDVTSGTPSVTSARTGHVAIGDINGDGLNDILVATSYWAPDMQPTISGGGWAVNIAGDGNPKGIVYYLNTSN